MGLCNHCFLMPLYRRVQWIQTGNGLLKAMICAIDGFRYLFDDCGWVV